MEKVLSTGKDDGGGKKNWWTPPLPCWWPECWSSPGLECLPFSQSSFHVPTPGGLSHFIHTLDEGRDEGRLPGWEVCGRSTVPGPGRDWVLGPALP